RAARGRAGRVAEPRPGEVARSKPRSRWGTLTGAMRDRFTPSQNEPGERQSAVTPTTSPHLREQLRCRGIDPTDLADLEVFHLTCALRGWHVTPRTAAGTRAIDARVWLAAALSTRGRYHAPA